MIAPFTTAGHQFSLSNDTLSLSRLSITYIESDEFRTLTLDQLLSEAPDKLYQEEEPTDAPLESAASDDYDLNHRKLLTPEGERYLFRKMNFCKFTASRLQAGTRAPRSGRNLSIFVTSRYPQMGKVSIDDLLKLANEARQLLVQANLRLVTSIATKTTNSHQDRDEFISEGNLILVNAIDKFDYSRGFRFSTYATHAIQRHFYRLMQRKQKRRQREVLSPTEILANAHQPVSTEQSLDPKLATTLIERFDDCLTPREKTIIIERFGLNGEESATLKTVAERVGLSKERVRQLQLSAIEKLQDLALQMRFHKETYA
ncbi:sigma-70 family RNA polymerase sigma factor [Planctomicrobium sp. SH527]|uniref:sigma-70 family RNA polymerase sigma factor n=1 Tax=Planctomicrobium sp. SH527 TaxID=3448123 RepID=UPI003F5B654D